MPVSSVSANCFLPQSAKRPVSSFVSPQLVLIPDTPEAKAPDQKSIVVLGDSFMVSLRSFKCDVVFLARSILDSSRIENTDFFMSTPPTFFKKSASFLLPLPSLPLPQPSQNFKLSHQTLSPLFVVLPVGGLSSFCACILKSDSFRAS